MAVLRAENIGFSYPDGTSALGEVSFTIGAGERVGIIGSNGAGKSTLARLLNGLLAPSTGKVWVDDWDTSVTPASLIATKVGYVFPYPRQQLFLPQAIAEVMFGPRNLGWAESECLNVAQEALEVVDLWEKRDANPQELGDCGRKRLSWATVMAMKSEVVIFDEPTASLDAHSWDCLQRVMATLRQRNSTVVVISHNMDLVADNCQRLLVLHEGHLRADAPLDQGWKAAEECGLELPCSRLLGRQTGRGEVSNSAEFLEALQERKYRR